MNSSKSISIGDYILVVYKYASNSYSVKEYGKVHKVTSVSGAYPDQQVNGWSGNCYIKVLSNIKKEQIEMLLALYTRKPHDYKDDFK